MTLFLFGITAVATGYLVRLGRWQNERAIRWKFFALRDRLRSAAISDAKLASDPLFARFDSAMTQDTKLLFSLWDVLALARREIRQACADEIKSLNTEIDASEYREVFRHFYAQRSELAGRALFAKSPLFILALGMCVTAFTQGGETLQSMMVRALRPGEQHAPTVNALSN